MNMLPIPALDPTPLPAPAWLFQVLLLVTFFVHIAFLNVTLGGTLLATTHALLAKGQDAPGRRLGRLMASLLPASVSFTVTMGVAPLLFIQLLYGQVFYAATVLIGWIWLAVVPLIVVAYYSVYLYKFEVGAPGGRTGWLGLAGLCFIAVAAIQTLVNVLQLTPPRWVAVASTLWAAVQDPTIPPRFLHFLLGSLAVGGIFLAVVGVERARRKPDPFFDWLARRGVYWALAATGLQMADGFWLLFSLPRDLLIVLVSGKSWPTIHLAVGMGLGFLTLMLLSGLRDPEHQPSLVRFTAGVLLATVLAMVGLRDVARGLYLSPMIRIRELPVQTQAGVTVLFLIVLVLGLATVAWMVRSVLRERRAHGWEENVTCFKQSASDR
jgi:hypothetical protein